MRPLVLVLALGLAAFPAIGAAAPVHVPYSGQLADGGAPLSGAHTLTVSLYDAPTGGTLLHSQSEPVQVEQGVFHVDLIVDDGIFATHDSLWVGVSVDAAAELEPRVRIGAVPYAVRALLTAQAAPPPGVAFATGFPELDVPATANWEPVATLALNAPASGHVWLTASGYWEERSNTLPNYVAVEFILGEGTPPPSDQRQQYYSFFQLRSWPFSHTTVLPAGAGAHTYTLWVRVTYIGGTLSQPPTFHPATMQALWVPNSYAN